MKKYLALPSLPDSDNENKLIFIGLTQEGSCPHEITEFSSIRPMVDFEFAARQDIDKTSIRHRKDIDKT